jgi:O-antigen/teichoic acid export membrane protein
MIYSLLGQFFLRLIGTLLIADQSPALNDLLYMYVNVLTLIIIYLLKHYFQGSLLILGIVLSVLPTLVFMIANIYYFSGRYNKYLPSLAYFDISKAKVLLNLGVQFFIVQLWAILLFSIGTVLISQFCGPEEVTKYTIVSRYFSLMTILGGIVFGPYWSAFTDAYSKNDIDWIHSSMKQLQYLVFWLSVGVTLMLLSSGYIFDLWLGVRIIIPKSLSILMAIQTLIILWNMPYVSFINGVGKIKLQLIVGGILGVLGIGLSILFMKYYNYGASGLVLATCIATLPTAFLWRKQFDKIIFNNATGIWGK